MINAYLFVAVEPGNLVPYVTPKVRTLTLSALPPFIVHRTVHIIPYVVT